MSRTGRHREGRCLRVVSPNSLFSPSTWLVGPQAIHRPRRTRDLCAVPHAGEDTSRLSLTTRSNIQIKICCIASIAEAELALECGANLLGLVSAMPSGPGVIADAEISKICEYVAGRARTVLLTSRRTAEEISAQLRQFPVGVVQLCDAIAETELATLRDAHPHVDLMRVIHVRGEGSVQEAISASRSADAILLDSGNPDAKVKELGGTGRVHDWELSRRIRDSIDTPLFLAGGLRAENVGDAVRVVRPLGVDVCSGVRENGVLIKSRLAAFIGQARQV